MARADEPIADNSFLVEEAYNQESGVVQHIQTMQLDLKSHDWGYTFTEEWPAPNEEHQVSVTVPVNHTDGKTTLGDLYVHYRRELFHGDHVVVTPRASLWLRTGQEAAPASGVQFQACVSVQPDGVLVLHSNVGVSAPLSNGSASDTYVVLGQSLIWLAQPKLNLLVEAAATFPTATMSTDVSRELVVSPGLRTAIDFSSGLQIVPGVAAPLSIDADHHAWALLFYLSFEHPLQSSRKDG
ncbi:MAG TPA: hypothetical protein VFV99_13055 [Kofleriaceae bacterium]|nr:hypothetical protein [Kofleriaceae bacterium]